MMILHLIFLLFLSLLITFSHGQDSVDKLYEADCNFPLKGLYTCDKPEIDKETQQPINCRKDNKAAINCNLRKGFYCKDTNSTRFTKDIDCLYTNRYYFETALLLSIFLGMFGADRFYLGYPALGFLKLSTFGFLFLGHFIDIILIALQIVGPSDGSNYIIKYLGPRLTILKRNNESFIYNKQDL